jgi:hypothetical protein
MLLIAVFGSIIAMVFNVDFKTIPQSDHIIQISKCCIILPTLFTSFGFQGSLHSLTKFCDNDRKLIKNACLYGSVIPAIVYIAWTFGVMSLTFQAVFTVQPPTRQAINQVELLNDFSANSWQSLKISALGNKTAEQWLVNIFNRLDWGPLRLQLKNAAHDEYIVRLLTPGYGDQTSRVHQLLRNNEYVSLNGRSARSQDFINGLFEQDKLFRKALKSKINIDIPPDLKNYYTGNPANPASWNQLIAEHPENNFALNDSPRQWEGKLSRRELCRFKDYINDLKTNRGINVIDNANYLTDDLIKARALSGVFWILDTTKQQDPVLANFSGMLIPAQPFNGSKYVYTCAHGFASGNASNNIVYYFVPYGVKASKKPTINDVNGGKIDNPDFVTKKGFRVVSTSIRGGKTCINIDDPFFKSPDIENLKLYRNNDFAIAMIKDKTDDGKSLKQLLSGTINPISTDTSDNLPKINVNDGILPVVDENANFTDHERLFAIGRAVKDYALDDGGVTIVPETYIAGKERLLVPRRSLKNDENKKICDLAGTINELAAYLPCYSGMSGGAVLRCRMDKDNPKNKKCEFIGTVWGSERVFKKDRSLSGFRFFMNKK